MTFSLRDLSHQLHAQTDSLTSIRRAVDRVADALAEMAEMAEPPTLVDLQRRLGSLRLGLTALHADAQRWLTESEDRPNLRAAECRIGKLLALTEGTPTQQSGDACSSQRVVSAGANPAPRTEDSERDRLLAEALAEVDDQIGKLPGIDVAIKTLRYVRKALSPPVPSEGYVSPPEAEDRES